MAASSPAYMKENGRKKIKIKKKNRKKNHRLNTTNTGD
jgi:hypothetical protein